MESIQERITEKENFLLAYRNGWLGLSPEKAKEIALEIIRLKKELSESETKPC